MVFSRDVILKEILQIFTANHEGWLYLSACVVKWEKKYSNLRFIIQVFSEGLD